MIEVRGGKGIYPVLYLWYGIYRLGRRNVLKQCKMDLAATVYCEKREPPYIKLLPSMDEVQRELETSLEPLYKDEVKVVEEVVEEDEVVEKPKVSMSSAYNARRWRWEYAGEDFTAWDVGERDSWICHLCGEDVDPELSFPHPRSRTSDHLVPFTKGGEHAMTNVKLAHLECNNLRNNASIEEGKIIVQAALGL